MDATCAIQASIHVFSLVRKYVSRILGTYHFAQTASFFGATYYFFFKYFYKFLQASETGYMDGVFYKL